MIIYTLVLIKLRRTLLTNYPQFFEREKTRIYISTLSIIISIVGRIIFIILQQFDSLRKALSDSVRDDTWNAPLFSLAVDFFTVLIPCASALYSLLYMI